MSPEDGEATRQSLKLLPVIAPPLLTLVMSLLIMVELFDFNSIYITEIYTYLKKDKPKIN